MECHPINLLFPLAPGPKRCRVAERARVKVVACTSGTLLNSFLGYRWKGKVRRIRVAAESGLIPSAVDAPRDAAVEVVTHEMMKPAPKRHPGGPLDNKPGGACVLYVK